MANKQKIRQGFGRFGPHPVNVERREARAAGLSGRQKVKARKEARRNAKRAAGLATVLGVKQVSEALIDPRAQLVVPSRRPPSPRPA